MFARAFYGMRGANLAALLRAFIACGWFGIQTWVGGEAIYVILGRLLGSWWRDAPEIAGQHWTLWLSFVVFWIGQMLIIWRGMDAVRRFENWTAPLVSVGFLIMLGYVLVKAGGLGPILADGGKLGWGPDFWKVFAPSLMAMIAFWSTLSLNMPDFTRFGGSQRKQVRGQILGLPTTMTFIAIVAILTTSGGHVLYGEDIWDPAQLADKFTSPVVVVVALVALVLATISANLAANVVSPSYDFSNAFPKKITFAIGGGITGVIGILIQPWRLYSDPNIYIFAWLGFYGGLLGAVAACAGGLLLGDRPHETQAEGPLHTRWGVLVQRRLELARTGRDAGRSRSFGRWCVWRAVPRQRAHPVPQAALRLQLGGRLRLGVRRLRRPVRIIEQGGSQ